MAKKLYRSKHDRILFGICGGLGEFLDVDPVIIRLIFVILAIWGGVGIILYILGIFLIPEEPSAHTSNDSEPSDKNKSEKFHDKVEEIANEIRDNVKNNIKNNPKGLKGDQIAGLIILVVGLLILFQNFFSWMGIWRLWPVIIIILGIALLSSGHSKGNK